MMLVSAGVSNFHSAVGLAQAVSLCHSSVDIKVWKNGGV